MRLPINAQFLKDPLNVALCVMVAVAFLWFEWVTWTQYEAHLVFLADAGVFDVLCAGPRHGHFLRTPLVWDGELNYFAIHFSPVLMFVMPFYFVADHVMTLLTLQNAALVGATVPLWLLAREVTRSPVVALAVAACWLTNHFTASVHLANHPEALGFIGFFGLFLAVQKRNRLLFVCSILWSLMIKEDYALWVGLYGVSLLLERDRSLRRWAFATMGTAAGWWILAGVVMSMSGAEWLATTGDTPFIRYASMGEAKSEIAVFVLTHPLGILKRILSPTLVILFLSTGFLALADWRAAWLTVAGAAIFLMTDDALVSRLHYYYSYPALPFLFYSTVRGVANILGYPGWKARAPLMVARVCAILLFVIAVVSIPMPTRTDGLRRLGFLASEHHRLAPEVIELIPRDAAVAVQYDLYTRVRNRAVKLPLRLQWIDQVEWVLVDLKGHAADLVGEEKREEAEELFERLRSDEFEEVFEGDGYVVLRRKDEGGRMKDEF